MKPPDPAIELFQFPYSHYNEKARWALDYKRLPHTRRSLLPGPHVVTVRRLSGQAQVPVVCLGGGVFHGSAKIIDELERRFPDPPLYPADAAARRRALEIQTWFDEEVGPQVRRALFSLLLNEADYLCRVMAADRNALKRSLYRASFPLLRPVIRKGMGITDQDSVDRALSGVEKALDFVAKEGGKEGFLVGDTFTVADLAAAALLAPVAMPPDSPMDLPQPRPQCITAWLARWAAHRGTEWILYQYRHSRPGSAEVAESS